MLVVKDNNLIQKAKSNLTSTQKKLISYVISLITPTDKEFQRYDISVSDFCYLCGIDRNHFYTEFKDIIDDLDNKAFWIKTDTKIFKFRWFSEAEYIPKQGKIRVLLHSQVKPYLLELKKNFTMYELGNILELKSKYSMDLYEILKSYSYQYVREFKIEELKDILNASGYTVFKDFRKRVLDVAIDDINNKTDLYVTYDLIKGGRGAKVQAINFHIKTKQYVTLPYLDRIAEIKDKRTQIKGQMNIFDYDQKS